MDTKIEGSKSETIVLRALTAISPHFENQRTGFNDLIKGQSCIQYCTQSKKYLMLVSMDCVGVAIFSCEKLDHQELPPMKEEFFKAVGDDVDDICCHGGVFYFLSSSVDALHGIEAEESMI